MERPGPPFSTYRIGQFAGLTGLSVKTLRYYGELGILRPTSVDPNTRYRCYSASQIRDANRIVALRDAGLTLAEIAAQDGAGLEQARARIQRRIDADRRTIDRLDALVEVGVDAVAVKYQPAMRVAVVREQLDRYDDVDELLQEVISEVPVAARGSLYGSFWANCVPGSSVDCEAFVEVTEPRLTPTGRATIVTREERRVAALVIDGRIESAFELGYQTLHRWLDRTGNRLREPKAEWYLAAPGAGSCCLTELRFPIEDDIAM